MRTRWIGFLIGAAFVVVVVLAAMNELRVTCEVCMLYRGGRICEEASAADRDLAVMQARNAACTQLSNGVTDGIQCNNSAPLSTTCNE